MTVERLHVASVKNQELAERELRKQGFATVRPLVRVREVRGRELRVTLRPMFPGYLLVAFDRYVQRWRAINSTRGVKRLICSMGGEPLALPESQASKLFAVSCSGPVDLTTPRGGDEFFGTEWREGVDALEEGDPVRITGGAYWGHTGTLHRWSQDRERVGLLLYFLGGARVVNVPVAMVEAAT